MFHKLRTRLLLMNLSMITILLFISFSTIYVVTYKYMQVSIDEELIRVSEFRKDTPQDLTRYPEDMKILEGNPANGEQTPPGSPADTATDIEASATTAKTPDGTPTNAPADLQIDNVKNDLFNRLPERTVSFTIISNDMGEIITKNSFFEADDTFYEEALAIANEKNQDRGSFNLEGSTWAYMASHHDNTTYYTFLDITSQHSMLDRLIYTFIFVFTGTFIVILFISRFLTNRSLQPVVDTFEKQKQFISDASHELKTPLAVIRTNVDVLLQNQSSKDSEDAKWLNYIKNEVSRMSTLTNDLLYLTQMSDDESQRLFHANFDLSDRIENQMLGLEVVAFEKAIQLDYQLEPKVMMNGNAEQITQVVMILMDNAIKYTPSGGKIGLTLKRTSHHIQVDVFNTGEGITEDDLPRIFERFYRVDKVRSRHSGSYGLGLSIAKAIVDQHGGKITCTSTPNVETRFTIRFKAIS